MKCVLVHGLAGSGKDTFADWLVAERRFVKLSLADPIKEFVGAVFPGVQREWLWGPSELRGSLVATKPVEDWPRIAAEFCARLCAPHPAGYDKLVAWVHAYADRCIAPLREVLQTLGTEWGRAVDEQLWARHLFQVRLAEVEKPEWYGWKPNWGDRLSWFGPNGVVVPDVRFQSEIVGAPRGRQAFKIRRPGEDTGPLAGGVAGHSSEQGLPDVLFDAVLDVPEGLERARFLYEAVYARFIE